MKQIDPIFKSGLSYKNCTSYNAWKLDYMINEDMSIKHMDITFKKVCLMLDYLEKNEILNIFLLFDFPMNADLNRFIEYLFCDRWQNVGKNNGKMLDYNKDIDILYATFLKEYGIDLIDDNIQWFKFRMLLEGVMQGENPLTTRLKYRTEPCQTIKNDRKSLRHFYKMRARYNLNNVNDNKKVIRNSMIMLKGLAEQNKKNEKIENEKLNNPKCEGNRARKVVR